jgi:coiled-coil and C2 domain-containing protein 2A
MFYVKIPVLSLGYEKTNSSLASEVPMLAGIIASGETLLHLFITLDPPLMQPPKLKLKFQTEESDRLLKYAKQWHQSLDALKRIIFSTTIDIHGKTVFITRYIRAQKPPEGMESVQQLARYVSLIPFIPNRTAFAADCHIWCSSEQMLEIGAGDATEHAILLCNFLLFKGLDAYVILGRGIPDGLMAYVLIKDESAPSHTSLNLQEKNEKKKPWSQQKFLFVDPVSGSIYRIQDTHIPLKEIGCMFNDKNVSLFLFFYKISLINLTLNRFGLIYKSTQICKG